MKSLKQTAFTLVEILVVLGIIGLALAVVPPVLTKAVPSSQVKSATRYLAAGLQIARIQAVSTKKESVLTLNVKDFTYRVGKTEKKLHLPEESNMTLITGKTEQTGEKSGSIRFFPDGSSTGGQIKLAYRLTEYEINVNWLTGKVSIGP